MSIRIVHNNDSRTDPRNPGQLLNHCDACSDVRSYGVIRIEADSGGNTRTMRLCRDHLHELIDTAKVWDLR